MHMHAPAHPRPAAGSSWNLCSMHNKRFFLSLSSIGSLGFPVAPHVSLCRPICTRDKTRRGFWQEGRCRYKLRGMESGTEARD